MVLIVSPQAQRDLDEAYEYIARDNPAAAAREMERLFGAINLIASGLVKGRRARLHGIRAARVWWAPPYHLYYRQDEGIIEIVRVYHHARRPIEQ